MFPPLPDLTPQLLSTLLGYLSIACWIIAQAPQIVENYFQQSCDGLALPFLLNWLCGDITNVIGCILTDQKEFQTLLATYFCLVDIVLAAQYAYYTRLKSSKTEKERQLLAAAQAGSGINYGSAGVNAGHGSGFSNITSGPTTPLIGATEAERSPLLRASRHSILSAELDVARAAEKVERRRSQSARRKPGTHQLGPNYPSSSQHQPTSAAVTSPGWGGSESSVMLTANDRDSIRGRPRGRPTNNSIDVERGGMQQSSGRSISTSPHATLKHLLPTSSAPATVKRTTSSGGQRPRAVGVVFMSVFLLAGIGRSSLKGLQQGERGGDVRVGGREQVIVPQAANMWDSSSSARHLSGSDQQILESVIMPVGSKIGQSHTATYVSIPSLSDMMQIQRLSPSSLHQDDGPHDGDKGDKPPNTQGHYQRIVGRVSAWVCTTLYLTSRLPQIWKNYQRRSVEGLSILLFVFAFMGNATYVGSILLNPGGEGASDGGKMSDEERAFYLLEALPYLLGSGGTLIFDLTIMCQALYYGSAKPVEAPISHHDTHPHTHAHHQHRSRSRSTFRAGQGTHGTRNASESRSFTSLDAVDEESQLLSKDDQHVFEIPDSAMLDSTGELTPKSSVVSRGGHHD